MKIKKLAAFAVATVMTAAVAVPLAACSKKPEAPKYASLGTTENVKLADYAKDFKELSENREEYDNVYDGYNSVKELFTLTSNDMYVSRDNQPNKPYIFTTKKVTGEGAEAKTTYSVYNAQLEKYIITDVAVEPIYNYNSLDLIILSYPVDGVENQYETEVYAYDGTVLLAKKNYEADNTVASFNKAYYYLKGEDEMSSFLMVTLAKTPDATEEVPDPETEYSYLFYLVDEDEETGNVTYKAVAESELSLVSAEFAKGEEIANGKKVINPFFDDEEKPVEGEIANYSYSVNNNTYTFYKAGEETGKLDLGINGRILNYNLIPLGNTLYYSVTVPKTFMSVDGYNLEVNAGDFVSKYDVQIHAYNVVENTDTTLNYDVILSGFMPMYNYTTKAYDAAVIEAAKTYDGVAYYSQLSDSSYVYLTDANLNVAYDLTGKLRNELDLYKIADGEYILNNNVYNDEAVPVYDDSLNLKGYKFLNLNNNYLAAGLVPLQTYGPDTVGFNNLDGKIVIEPKYTPCDFDGNETNELKFYGGAALVKEAQIDGSEKLVFLKTDGTTVDVESYTKEAAGQTKTLDAQYFEYGLFTVTTETEEEKTFEVYNFAGKKLYTFTCAADDMIGGLGIMEMDNFLALTVQKTVKATETTEAYTEAKLCKLA